MRGRAWALWPHPGGAGRRLRTKDEPRAASGYVMTRNQVPARAGVSMLAQANGMPQMVLQLIRG